MNKAKTLQTVPSIAAQQNYWDQRWRRQSSPNGLQTRRSDAVLAIARELRLENPRILDLGCGTGFTTDSLSELGVAEGIDLSPTAIDIAKTDYPSVTFQAGDLYDLLPVKEPVDLVVCQEVIPHVSDQPRLVKIIADSVKMGGYLIITAANKFVMKRAGDGDEIDAHIKDWLSTKELTTILKPHFEVLKTTSVLPIGNQGILRLINSHKINWIANRLISPQRVESLKGRFGLGYTIITVAQKKA